MYRTIQLSSCVLVQGEFVEVLADGQIVIRDGKTTYRGRPINKRSMTFMHDAMNHNADLASMSS